jgi:hypothetical protein
LAATSGNESRRACRRPQRQQVSWFDFETAYASRAAAAWQRLLKRVPRKPEILTRPCPCRQPLAAFVEPQPVRAPTAISTSLSWVIQHSHAPEAESSLFCVVCITALMSTSVFKGETGASLQRGRWAKETGFKVMDILNFNSSFPVEF